MELSIDGTAAGRRGGGGVHQQLQGGEGGGVQLHGGEGGGVHSSREAEGAGHSHEEAWGFCFGLSAWRAQDYVINPITDTVILHNSELDPGGLHADQCRIRTPG